MSKDFLSTVLIVGVCLVTGFCGGKLHERSQQLSERTRDQDQKISQQIFVDTLRERNYYKAQAELYERAWKSGCQLKDELKASRGEVDYGGDKNRGERSWTPEHIGHITESW